LAEGVRGAGLVFCIFAGLLLFLLGLNAIADLRRKQEYAKLLAEFKRDGMNDAVYEKIVQILNHGAEQGQLNEVLSLRYNAILKQLIRVNSPALRIELMNVGRRLRELAPDPLNSEWNEQRFTNDLAALPTDAHFPHSGDIAAQIEELGNLCKKGEITLAEFERGKALFLGSPPDIAAQTLNVLEGLHKLKTSGALSESEYNIKKWELLGGKNLNPK
jgi:hypothetical protein